MLTNKLIVSIGLTWRDFPASVVVVDFGPIPNSRNRGASMDPKIIAIIVQVVSGAVGGNIVGAVASKLNLGPLGNSIAGIVGGGLGGQILGMVLGGGAAAAAAPAGGMDMGSIISSIAGGGVGGAVVMAIVGLIKSKMGGANA